MRGQGTPSFRITHCDDDPNSDPNSNPAIPGTPQETEGRSRVEEIQIIMKKLTREVQISEEVTEQKRRALMNDQTPEEVEEDKKRTRQINKAHPSHFDAPRPVP